MTQNTEQVRPSFLEAVREYFRVGLLSFGGPAAQIALMHKIFVVDKSWLSETQYLRALSFCMLLPGPEAMQLSTYVGWRLHGIWGGIAAGVLFVVPGACLILGLAVIYVSFGAVPWVEGVFLGIKAAVLVIVIEALLRVSKKVLHESVHWVIAGSAFVALFVFDVAYPLVVCLAGCVGFLRTKAQKSSDIHHESKLSADAHFTKVGLLVSLKKTLFTAVCLLGLWFLPLFAIGWITDWGFLYDLGMFFSKLASVTFGGAYAVLAYMSQEVVSGFGWLSTDQMMDALGLAETTPGPLILVTEFVGFVAGYQAEGFGLALAAASLVLWVTFVPCFLWIFVGAPYIEWITAQPKLQGALAAVTAAVVGVILNLSVWFGLHILFESLETVSFGANNFGAGSFGIGALWWPDLKSINVLALILATLSFYCLILRHMNVLYVIMMSAVMGVLLNLAV